MSLINITSPHVTGPNSVTMTMAKVNLALLPALSLLTIFFGWGYVVNIVFAVILACLFEAVVAILRKRPVLFLLKDLSAVTTAVLLALALPPFLPWWCTLVGILFAIVFVKHMFGGLGQNPFNPAMAAYALLLISFPVQMTTNWAALADQNHNVAGLFDSLVIIFQGEVVDAYTAATSLDLYKQNVSFMTQDEITQQFAQFGNFVAYGWEWVSIAYLLGGVFLIQQRVITWHTPVSLLLTLTLMALIFSHDADVSTPLSLHLLAGATMLGAFFIATDPVSGATSNRGKVVFAVGVGIFTYIFRTWGPNAEGFAFAVLLMNFAAPFIDHYTRPRTYGESSAKKGYK